MAFTRYHSFKIEPNLYLVEPVGGRTYQARARVDGKWHHVGTETADFKQAEQFALRWFRQLRAGREGAETVQQAADAYFTSIRDAGKRAYHTATYNATKGYWHPGMGKPSTLVTEITTPKLLAFVKWRQDQSPQKRSPNARITSNTMHKDLVTLRQVLKYAVARGVITHVPEFPGAHIIGSIERNVQTWLTKEEWSHLLKVAEQRIKDAPNVRTQAQRTELLVWLRFMHATGMRVDEARHVRVKDIRAKYTEPASATEIDRRIQDARSTALVVVDVQLRYLEITLHKSKTGPRQTLSRKPIHPSIVTWLEARRPDDAVFSAHHRDAFRELLIAAGLRSTPYGTRNAKCLRPTSISHWLLSHPTIPLSWLAANTGTSITMLSQFYVKRLGLALDGTAWL